MICPAPPGILSYNYDRRTARGDTDMRSNTVDLLVLAAFLAVTFCFSLSVELRDPPH